MAAQRFGSKNISRFIYGYLYVVGALLAIHICFMAKVNREFDSRILKRLDDIRNLQLSRFSKREIQQQREDNMNKLRSTSFPHGTFFFNTNSHQVKIPANDIFDPSASWTPLQRELLDDADINIDVEKKRCASYNFGFPSNTTLPLKRRRLFYGAMISGESAEVMKATSMEQYNIYHTVSLIESNTTQNLTPKKWRFFGSEDASKELHWLYQLFGPKTKVAVDYYVTTQTKNQTGGFYSLALEGFQREGFAYRWKLNGMRPDDIAIVGDLDETYSRDFLRALQICDVPQFRPGQTCRGPKVIASTLMFESSPECAWKKRRWYHPDSILGECVDQIGDPKLHPPTHRIDYGSHGNRLSGYGKRDDYSKYDANVLAGLDNMKGQGPLWLSHEIRTEVGGVRPTKKDDFKSPTAYHFHNFFMSGEEIRFKYSTFGHADEKILVKSLRHISARDLMLAVMCALGNHTKESERSFESISGTSRPIYYLNEEVRHARHSMWQDIVKKDEEKYGQINGV